MCLSGSNKMVQAVDEVFNIFLMETIWLKEVIATYLSMYIWGLCSTQYPKGTGYKCHYCSFVPLLNIAMLKDFSLLWPWEWCQGQMAYFIQISLQWHSFGLLKRMLLLRVINLKEILFPLEYIGKMNFSHKIQVGLCDLIQ